MTEQPHTFDNAYPVKHWVPDPPDMAWADVIAAIEPRALSFSMNSQIYKFKKERKAYKAPASQREFDLMMEAGDCAVKVHGRSLWKDKEGAIRMSGIIMDHETPFDPKTVEDSQRKCLMDQIISVLCKLHRKGIIHGDVKPANFLLCTDGRLRLCDFSDAMRVGEDQSSWGGLTTTNYISPRRTRNWPDGADPPPTIEDDLYSLGLSLWELYTRRTPFEGWYEDDIMSTLQRGETVDVDEVEDEDVKSETLDKLKAHNIPIAIVSNEGVAAVKTALERKNMARYIHEDLIIGDKTPGAQRKPDPASFVNVLAPTLRDRSGMGDIDVRNVLVIGDTVADIQFARNIGGRACWCRYGYGDRDACKKLDPELIVDSLSEVAAYSIRSLA